MEIADSGRVYQGSWDDSVRAEIRHAREMVEHWLDELRFYTEGGGRIQPEREKKMCEASRMVYIGATTLHSLTDVLKIWSGEESSEGALNPDLARGTDVGLQKAAGEAKTDPYKKDMCARLAELRTAWASWCPAFADERERALSTERASQQRGEDTQDANDRGAGDLTSDNSRIGSALDASQCEARDRTQDPEDEFDVFLSHNSSDKPMVCRLGKALQARGFKVWLDEWELVPGRPWQEAIEEIIYSAKTAAVLVAKDGLGPWEEPEMRGCLSEFVNRGMPVIPVLLPGCPAEPQLPLLLKQFTWVDLRKGLRDEGLNKLIWGISGHKP